MIVICEECGKKYKIDPEKIKGDEAKVRCKACNHVFLVRKPEAQEEERPPTPPPTQPEPSQEESVVEEHSEKRQKVEEELREETQPISLPKKRKMGLRTKMFILFVILPIVLMAGAGIFYMQQLNQLSHILTNESSQIVSQMAENIIEEKARAVAAQVQLFLLAHPLLKKEEFNKYEPFKQIAVQKVGKTGYTALYELPGPDGIWRTWAHPIDKIIAIDMSKLKKPLGKNFPGFWKVYTGVKGGRESRGYYNWQDKDGQIRAKFMVCTPVRGTRYVVAATTYLDEFTVPVRKLEARASVLTSRVRNMSIVILVGTLILIGLIVSIYGHLLTRRIKSLTQLAERISVGELDAELKVKSTDEIGDLAEAIGRMQESIRLSIERLRRRR
ncbi:MAG: hypothetical protein DRH12_06855 [Deltaproteobacteria bacterium]|nr:MAG: hypothetical protein DRH12_06855 [Deltaproteobacteria bacterium]